MLIKTERHWTMWLGKVLEPSSWVSAHELEDIYFLPKSADRMDTLRRLACCNSILKTERSQVKVFHLIKIVKHDRLYEETSPSTNQAWNYSTCHLWKMPAKSRDSFQVRCEFFWPLHPQMSAVASNFHVYLICSFEGGREERRGETNREQCWAAEWVAWSPCGVAGSQSEDFWTETKGVGAGGTHSYWQLGLGEGESSVLWPLSHYHPNLPDNPRGPFLGQGAIGFPTVTSYE